MRNRICNLLLLAGSLIISTGIQAQNNEAAESTMRSNGKIYVVNGHMHYYPGRPVLYLVSIDRKIARIEDKQ